MIETIHIPILLKAIDFIFEEGRKILEERRERRKLKDDLLTTEGPEAEKAMIPLEAEKGEEIKQDLLASKIDEIAWQSHQMEVEHLVRLLESHTRNYYLAREQYAKWGSELVPSIIMHRLTDAENNMIETIKRLEAVLSKVYKKDILPNE